MIVSNVALRALFRRCSGAVDCFCCCSSACGASVLFDSLDTDDDASFSGADAPVGAAAAVACLACRACSICARFSSFRAARCCCFDCERAASDALISFDGASLDGSGEARCFFSVDASDDPDCDDCCCCAGWACACCICARLAALRAARSSCAACERAVSAALVSSEGCCADMATAATSATARRVLERGSADAARKDGDVCAGRRL